MGTQNLRKELFESAHRLGPRNAGELASPVISTAFMERD